jgi:hypothetical protein
VITLAFHAFVFRRVDCPSAPAVEVGWMRASAPSLRLILAPGLIIHHHYSFLAPLLSTFNIIQSRAQHSAPELSVLAG